MDRFLVTLAAAGTVAALFATLATPVPVAAQREQRQTTQLPHYTITDLGTLGGTMFADADMGWVESASTLAGTHQHAFLRRDGAFTDLGILGVGSSSLPGDMASTTSLPTLGGGNGEVFGINDKGQAVGAAENGLSDTTCPSPRLEAKPVVWGRDDVQELPTFPGDPDGAASAINDHNQIVGASGGCLVASRSVRHALLWQHGTVADLGNLGGRSGNFATDINNRAEVVGQSNVHGDKAAHAFRWTEGSGMQDLGTLHGDVASQAIGINDEGRIVGLSIDAGGNSAAFIWHDGAMTDLNTLVPADSPLFLFVASDIDARGWIVGWGVDTSTGEIHAFLATPSNDEPVSGDSTSVAQGVSIRRPRGPLPENIRERFRQGLGFRRFLGSLQKMALVSSAAISGPNFTLSTTSLKFPTVGIGTSSTAKVVTLGNYGGTATLTINSIAITGANAGDFALTHNCGISLTPGVGCSIKVTFKPQATGTRTAAVSISDNAAGSPQKVTLSGIGTTASLSPTRINFGSAAVGYSSAPQLLTLSNVGTTVFSISSITIVGTNPGDFAETHTCGNSLVPGASCSISVSFRPTFFGTRSAALKVTDSAPSGTQKVPLVGTGVSPDVSYNHCVVSGGVLTGACLLPPFLGGTCVTPQITTKCPVGQPAKGLTRPRCRNGFFSVDPTTHC